jgi:hypothetical protein
MTFGSLSITFLICGLSQLRPSSNPMAAPKRTPVKAEAMYSLDTTRSSVDQRLQRELNGHLWITDTDCFFDQFFPLPTSDAPPPPSFPPKPTEKAVVQWLSEYNSACIDAGALVDCPWVWAVSPDLPLIHPDTKRKLDLFIYPKNPINAAVPDEGGPGKRARKVKKKKARQEHTWSQVAVIGELKCEKGLGDLNKKVVVQTASYVREMMFMQPGRRFAHAFSIINSKMRCWVSSSQGVLVAMVSPSGCFRLVLTLTIRCTLAAEPSGRDSLTLPLRKG